MINTPTLIQLLRFGVTGLISNALLYGAYLALTAAGLGIKWSMTLLYIAGVFQTFIVNKRWAFLYRGPHYPALLRYCVSYALGYFINLFALFALVDKFGYDHQIVQGIMILVLAVMLFILQKFWVFRKSQCLPLAIWVKE